MRRQCEPVTDLVLVPEVEARRVLRHRRIRLRVLAPYGAWLGRGTLRVVRVRIPPGPSRVDDRDGASREEAEAPLELTCGYEAYQP